MDIHPLLVHFPIAFLMVYALLEIITVFYFQRFHQIIFVKTFLLAVGMLGAFAALVTGYIAGERLGAFAVLEAHRFWAQFSAFLFLILCVGYLLYWLDIFKMVQKLPNSIRRYWNFVEKLRRFILKPVVRLVLACSGLASIGITGALGASMVFGTTYDPVITIVYRLLGL